MGEMRARQEVPSIDGVCAVSPQHPVWRDVVRSSPNGVVLLDASGAVVFANDAARRILGTEASYLRAGRLPEHWRQASPASPAVPDEAAPRGRSTHCVVREDGSTVDVEVVERSVGAGDHPFTVWICRDITARLRIDRALRESQENFRNVVDKNQTGILITDSGGFIRFANPAVAVMLGRDAEALLGSEFGTPVTTTAGSELQILRPGGGHGVAESLFTETEWHGEPAYLVMLHDVTTYREAQEAVRRLAHTDQLTGLPNRYHLSRELERVKARAERAGERFALLFLDLDRFKLVNDTQGHAVGDRLLIEVARRLQAALRASDTVARLGGDEFAIVIEGVDEERAVERVARNVASAIRQAVWVGGRELFVSASIGCSLYPVDSEDPEDLLRQADTAMYRAKRSSEDFAWYSKSMTDNLLRATQLEHKLRLAVEQQQFEVYYQVKVELATQKPVGYEALLRWNHPDRGVVGPVEFIPALEDTGLIVDVGLWTLREVCRQLREWKDARAGRVLPVAINMSAVQVEREDLPRLLGETLEQFEIDPELLVIEITESTMLNYLGESIPRLRALTRLGVELQVDDFGTGYSSLSLLKRLPFSTVKIDQAFVRNITSDAQDLALTRATVTMCEGLGKYSLAEGVETEEQRALLRDVGCEYGQGYLFGRPVPAARV
jgi:diguanylate cyclase (GGDEF)-like protein/PAS domain S-box-containing protein